MSERSDGELTIAVPAGELGGWEEIDVTLSAEAFPPTFSIAMSSATPIGSNAVVAKAGDSCVVSIGGDVVITGYIDRDINGGDANGHRLQLLGRGRTQDLVDCSAEWDGGQILSATALEIATRLAKPYSVSVRLAEGASPGDPVPQTNLNYGETGAAIIQRIARNAALLAYENSAGELVLAGVGQQRAASGAVYGMNVQAWQSTNAMDQRFSQVRCCSNNLNVYGDVTGSGGDDSFFFDTEPDPNVPRHRLLYLPLEEAVDPRPFTIKKAKWEVARRAGRSAAVQVTLDSWRDNAGALWRPNTIVPVDVPGNRGGADLCISEVTFHRSSERGTVADLYLLPPAAFAPEPVSLQPVNTADLKGPTDP